jgi:hypothetical protein
MVTRARVNDVGLTEFLAEAEQGLSTLNTDSSKEMVSAAMAVEGERLNKFFGSVVIAADNILDTGLIPNLVSEHWYYGVPCPRPEMRLCPADDYFKQVFNRRGSKGLKDHPDFRWDLVLPGHGESAGLELKSTVYLSYGTAKAPEFELSFEVNFDDTLMAFKWLLREWRRPIGQLLRGLPRLQLWGNGTTIEGSQNCRSKDPAFLLEHHLGRQREIDGTANLFSLRALFSPEDTNDDLVTTCAVFLSLFDAVYRLSGKRVDPDRLLRHYHKLLPLVPKAAFRGTSIFSKEPAGVS